MTPGERITQRRFLLRSAAAVGALVLLTGCDRLSQTEWFPKVLRTHETLNRGVHKLLGSRPSMAQEFTEADLSPFFRSNGTAMPEGEEYQALAKNGFADWQLEVGGLVEKPAEFRLPSCARCRAARRSRAMIASRAGARSANGPACRCRTCWRWCSRSRARAMSCSIAPIRWRGG